VVGAGGELAGAIDVASDPVAAEPIADPAAFSES